MSSEDDTHTDGGEGSVIDTLQSLIIAFVVAMTFRGFVAEGFVIPTGSMAPTLLGQHLLVHAPQTGIEFPVDARSRPNLGRLFDPMLGRHLPMPPRPGAPTPRPRGGDRVLIVKTLYPLRDPDRWDVVVFVNPTAPHGASRNYIKRLVGLPGETLWLADGDVFTRKSGEVRFTIRRKPEHVQQVVWQTVHDSDAIPTDPDRMSRRWGGPPWEGAPDGAWALEGRAWSTRQVAPSRLTWNHHAIPIDDFNTYNMLLGLQRNFPVSDLRVLAAIEPGDEGLVSRLVLEAGGHRCEFELGAGQATVRMHDEQDPSRSAERSVPMPPMAAHQVVPVEFRHVDQSMSIHLDGDSVVEVTWDWTPAERLRRAHDAGEDADLAALFGRTASPPRLTWHFEGAPVTLHRVRLERDLHYRTDRIRPRAGAHPAPPGQADLVAAGAPAYGTHPEALAHLDEDQFFMLGDNSPLSLDGRLWGAPHPHVAHQVDPAPFVVNRNLLLGKAWVVYFPAPLPLREGGPGIVPDFGRLRFIR